MGTFCRNCGRALADGEVCHCTDPIQTENTATEQTTSNIPNIPNIPQAQGNTQMPNMGVNFNQQPQGNMQFNQQMPNTGNQFGNMQFNPQTPNQFNPNMQQNQFNAQMPNMNGNFNPNMNRGFNPNGQNNFNNNMPNGFVPNMPNSFSSNIPNGFNTNVPNGFNPNMPNANIGSKSIKESGNLKGIIALGLTIVGLLILLVKSASFGNTLYAIGFIISAIHIYSQCKMYGGQIGIFQYFKSMLTDKSATPFLHQKVFAIIIAILPIMAILGVAFGHIQAQAVVDDSIDSLSDYLFSLY